MNNRKNTKQLKFVNSQFMKATRIFIFCLLYGLSFFSMLSLFLFSLTLIIIGIVSVILGIIHEEFLKSSFIVSMIHIIAIISGILGLWIWTYVKRWRRSAKIYWENRLVFPAVSFFFFSIFPPIILFYIPFKNRFHFRLSGRLENLETSPPEAYHDFVLEEMKAASLEAKGDKNKFLELFEERVKKPVRENPELLTKEGWPGG